jgi:uncharacterized membrane protein HdeD (DUF308 family)
MDNQRDAGGVVLRGVLWVARGLGLLVAAFVGFFVVAYTFGGEHSPPGLAALIHPFGAPVGYLIGWWRPLVGGVIGLGCLIAFAIWRGSGVALSPGIGVLFVLPGVLFVIYGIVSWARGRAR